MKFARAAQTMLVADPQQLLSGLKSSCGDALAELLTACPGQNLSVHGEVNTAAQHGTMLLCGLCNVAVLRAGHALVAWSLSNMHRHFDHIYGMMTLNHRVGAAQWH